MSAAFEQIRQAEQEAERILSAARENAAAIKKESAEAVAAIESAFQAELKAFQAALGESDKAAIEQKCGELDAAWDNERAEMDSRFAAEKAGLVRYLVVKVMQTYDSAAD